MCEECQGLKQRFKTLRKCVDHCFLWRLVASKTAVNLFRSGIEEWTSLATSVLRDGLGTLTDCVLCEFSWKEQSDGCLNLAGADSGLLVVVG